MKKQLTLNKLAKVRCEICGKEFKLITIIHLKIHNITSDEYRKQFPDALMVSEDWRIRQREAHLGKHRTEETKQNIRKAHLGKKHTEESKQKMSDNHADFRGEKSGMYGMHQTEEAKQKLREANSGKHFTEDHKKNMSKSKLGKHHTEESKQKMRDSSPHISGEDHPTYGKTGEKAPNWQGGISNLPYCEKFDSDFKERVRDFFGRCCYVCGMNETENGEKLSVHHVNYDKMVCCNDVKPIVRTIM